MVGWPVFVPDRDATAFAISMLIAVSSFGSELKPSTLKNNQLLSSCIVVCTSKSFA